MKWLDNPRATPEQRLTACKRLIRFGEIGRPSRHLSPMLDDPALAGQAKGLLEQIRALRQLGLKGEHLAGGDRLPKRAPRGSRLLAGAGAIGNHRHRLHRAGESGSTSPSTSCSGLLKRFGFNVIYVFDWTDTYYFAGIRGLGDNYARDGEEPQATVHEARHQAFDLLRAVVRRLRGNPLRSEAEAPMACCHSAPSSCRHEGADSRQHRGDDRSAAARRGRSTSGASSMRSKRIPLTKIVFGDANKADVRSARHLSGLPNVVEHVLPGVDYHGTVEVTTARPGAFPRIFSDFCDEVGPGRRWANAARDFR